MDRGDDYSSQSLLENSPPSKTTIRSVMVVLSNLITKKLSFSLNQIQKLGVSIIGNVVLSLECGHHKGIARIPKARIPTRSWRRRALLSKAQELQTRCCSEPFFRRWEAPQGLIIIVESPQPQPNHPALI
ncbi:hypothetical protein J6590_055257 [Homalodisca vitripennis]|nr:hypothetical protein J6590_055257 [Homalodisca vitripennis]